MLFLTIFLGLMIAIPGTRAEVPQSFTFEHLLDVPKDQTRLSQCFSDRYTKVTNEKADWTANEKTLKSLEILTECCSAEKNVARCRRSRYNVPLSVQRE
jgi:hypothetical protein